VAFEDRRRELPARTIVRVIAEVEPERSREVQVLRCSVGVKSVVGYILAKRTWLEPIEGPLTQLIEAIEQIEKKDHGMAGLGMARPGVAARSQSRHT
jgi:hypothetical protein